MIGISISRALICRDYQACNMTSYSADLCMYLLLYELTKLFHIREALATFLLQMHCSSASPILFWTVDRNVHVLKRENKR